ncbi:hypothetical protein LZ554_007384 [Drepanopeziza brunnea f. sp. 'monogermtubi']|nr:hypothetical protein LZ554_007384 [Drepanopeziza brunnea f. sp. 'monogermtubi']
MPGEASTEVPLHYGGKTDGDPAPPISPIRAYHQPRMGSSPERAAHEPSGSEDIRGVLRRRASNQAPPRRYSGGEYDGIRPSISQDGGARRPLRSRDDVFYREDERGFARRDDYHQDTIERSRPPRTNRHFDAYEKPLGSASKPCFEDSDRDVEAGTGWRDHRKRVGDEESIDGYNYDAHRNPRTALNFKTLSPEEKAEVMRLPWTQWMNSEFKNHFVATIGEFVGTTMFLFFAFAGTQVANIRSDSDDSTTSGGATGFNVAVYLYISVIFGFSLMVNVWIFFRISGGLFNPAVTLGMVMVGAIPPIRAICLFFAQIGGGIAASGMVTGLFPTKLNVRTTLAGGASTVQGVFIEAILTAELVFTIFMLAKEKHKATFIAPVGIGLALFIAEMVGVYYTGGSLNPARSFGPCVVTGVFDKEHWIYWVGPMIGTFIAVFFYKFIKMLEYEMANPGQDGDDMNDPTQNDEKKAEIMQRREAKYASSR